MAPRRRKEIDTQQIWDRLGQLTASIKTFNDVWQTQDAAATEGRRVLHNKFDGLTSTVNSLSTTVERLSDRVTVMEPIVKAADRQQIASLGLKKLFKAFWLLIVAISSVLVNEIFNFFHFGK